MMYPLFVGLFCSSTKNASRRARTSSFESLPNSSTRTGGGTESTLPESLASVVQLQFGSSPPRVTVAVIVLPASSRAVPTVMLGVPWPLVIVPPPLMVQF
ncbi:MAG: hypothetical protein QUS14_11785 [Pyrinomonadaceae bacterium]|nr:hypothetical protein [Pyrinomonadaceae bacterium]